MKQCTTHNHACDCREEQFQRLLEAVKKFAKSVHLDDEEAEEAYGVLIKAIKECEK
jgi:hypothetical protein